MHPPLMGHSSSILFSNNGKKCKIRFQFAVRLGVYSVHKETYNWSHLRHRISWFWGNDIKLVKQCFFFRQTAEKTTRMGGLGWKIRKTWKVSSYHQLQEQYQMKVTFWSSWKDFWRAARVWAAKLNQGWKEDRERKIHFDNGSPTIQKKVRIDKSFSSIKTHPGK